MKRSVLRVSGLVRVFLVSVCALSAWASPLADGDRWVVIGDSITHGRRYHSFVYLFYATRYPDRDVRTFNCGISGDSAGGAVQRFEWDIKVHRPTVATIMLGMNDVGRGLYAPGQTGAAVEKRRQECIDGHVANMTRLAELLSAEGCRIVFLTPSIYDQTGDLQATNCVGVNDALGVCGQRMRELAPRFGADTIDLHGPMTELNQRMQQADPALTLVGPDRVHPGDVGQFVMAYLILKGMGVTGTVADMAVDAASGAVKTQANCRISAVQASATTVQFTCLANALPYPVHAAARDALDLVPFTDELNREVLRVTGLGPGTYVVAVDGNLVAAATHAELAVGVNLAANERSPMAQQALEVLAAEEARHAIPARRLRTFAAQRHWLTRGHPDLDPDDFEAMKAILLAGLEKKKGTSNYGYFKGQADAYIAYKPKEKELLQELEERTAEVRRLSQPRPHAFSIRPLTAADEAELAGRVVDAFNTYSGWRFTGWTDTEPVITAKDGVLTVRAPRTNGRRDMLGLQRNWTAELSDETVLKVRLKADAGSHFGIEVVVDGKLTRIASYVTTSGEWEVLSYPLRGKRAASVTLILAEPSENVVWNADHTTYELDRLWLE